MTAMLQSKQSLPATILSGPPLPGCVRQSKLLNVPLKSAFCQTRGLRDSAYWKLRAESTRNVSAEDETASTVVMEENTQKKGSSEVEESRKATKARRRQADSTDWIATALTRRFGLAGGLAWLGVLTFGVVSEQVKTRLEVAREEAGTKEVSELREITKPSGVKYTDLKVGGGSQPVPGYLTIVDFQLRAGGEVIFDTRERGKPSVFVFGSRPASGAICAGLEDGISDMRAGGRRLVTVPPALGFGGSEAVIGDRRVPAGSELEYDVSLERISIPPS